MKARQAADVKTVYGGGGVDGVGEGGGSYTGLHNL